MIYLGADHGGFKLKEEIKKWLSRWGYQWEDLGNKFYDKEDDYPKFAFAVAKRVALEERKLFSKESKFELYQTKIPWKERPKGIIACRSAAGMVIAANKVEGARCAAVFDLESAKHCREHNDVNVLALAGDWLDEAKAKKILAVWLDTEFSFEERHIRRLRQIHSLNASLRL